MALPEIMTIMPIILYSARAKRDIKNIGIYLAARNPNAADKLVSTIYNSIEKLAHFPSMGARCTELKGGFHHWVIDNYVVIYKPVQDGVHIARILHGSRHFPTLL